MGQEYERAVQTKASRSTPRLKLEARRLLGRDEKGRGVGGGRAPSHNHPAMDTSADTPDLTPVLCSSARFCLCFYHTSPPTPTNSQNSRAHLRAIPNRLLSPPRQGRWAFLYFQPYTYTNVIRLIAFFHLLLGVVALVLAETQHYVACE